MNNFNTFFDQFPTTSVQKGEVILQQNYVPHHAYVLKSGFVKVVSFTNNGEEKSVAFKVAGDLIPIYWIFGKSQAALYYYQAHTDCVLYVLDRDDILQHVDGNHDFAKFVLDQQVIAHVNHELRVEALEQSRAHLKLLYTFRHLALLYGIDMKRGMVKITIPLTQQELANFVGLTRETTIAALGKLRRDNVVRCDHRYYTVNTPMLREATEDDYDPGIMNIDRH